MGPVSSIVVIIRYVLDFHMDSTRTRQSITQTFPCIMQRFSKAVKKLILNFNIDCKYTLESRRNSDAVLASTHNLRCRAKIKKMYTHVNPSFTV